MFYRVCRGCGGTMDPGEGCGNLCDDCIRKADRERAQGAASELMLEMAMRKAFFQMELGDFANG